MNYSLLTYDFKGHFNLGDYIQSLAAKQFLPQIDQYINREKLSDYSGSNTKMIMNGWYMRHTDHWPPSPKITPLFISFHMNTKRASEMLRSNGLNYLKKHEPVGCRDTNTFKLLKDNNIRAYFSNCLTLTLGNSYRHSPEKDILFVDVLFKYPTLKSVFKSFNSFQKSLKNGEFFLLGKRKKVIQKIFGNNIFQAIKVITHHYSCDLFPTEASRFELAEKTLKQYEKAKLVITSRIHCALPCLAMGTPVIFIDGGFESLSEQCRLDGICQLFNTIEITKTGHIASNFNLNAFQLTGSLPVRNEHLKYLETLNNSCEEFIKNKNKNHLLQE